MLKETHTHNAFLLPGPWLCYKYFNILIPSPPKFHCIVTEEVFLIGTLQTLNNKYICLLALVRLYCGTVFLSCCC